MHCSNLCELEEKDSIIITLKYIVIYKKSDFKLYYVKHVYMIQKYLELQKIITL